MSDAQVQDNASSSGRWVGQAGERVRPLAICLTIEEDRKWRAIKRKLRRDDDGAAFRKLLAHPLLQQIVEEVEAKEAAIEEVPGE